MNNNTRRPPARMSEQALREAALFYLGRYASSSGNLSQVLKRKILRSSSFYGDDPEPLLQIIGPLVAQLVQAGAVDDAYYAETRMNRLRARGRSGRAIEQMLNTKGVPAATIETLALELESDRENRLAAARLAKHRKIGPFRGTARSEFRLKDLGILARAGFAYDIASKVIDAADELSLMGWIEEARS